MKNPCNCCSEVSVIPFLFRAAGHGAVLIRILLQFLSLTRASPPVDLREFCVNQVCNVLKMPA
jgi:hypothetical protein